MASNTFCINSEKPRGAVQNPIVELISDVKMLKILETASRFMLVFLKLRQKLGQLFRIGVTKGISFLHSNLG